MPVKEIGAFLAQKEDGTLIWKSLKLKIWLCHSGLV